MGEGIIREVLRAGISLPLPSWSPLWRPPSSAVVTNGCISRFLLGKIVAKQMRVEQVYKKNSGGIDMGSSGSGRFTDYSGSKPTSGGGAGSGGSSGSDQCRQAISAELEEVAQCDFFASTSSVPAPGTVLTLRHEARIVAVDGNGARVGVLPTKYNYLAVCLREGISYSGIVVSSSVAPIPRVTADFVAI